MEQAPLKTLKSIPKVQKGYEPKRDSCSCVGSYSYELPLFYKAIQQLDQYTEEETKEKLFFANFIQNDIIDTLIKNNHHHFNNSIGKYCTLRRELSKFVRLFQQRDLIKFGFDKLVKKQAKGVKNKDEDGFQVFINLFNQQLRCEEELKCFASKVTSFWKDLIVAETERVSVIQLIFRDYMEAKNKAYGHVVTKDKVLNHMKNCWSKVHISDFYDIGNLLPHEDQNRIKDLINVKAPGQITEDMFLKFSKYITMQKNDVPPQIQWKVHVKFKRFKHASFGLTFDGSYVLWADQLSCHVKTHKMNTCPLHIEGIVKQKDINLKKVEDKTFVLIQKDEGYIFTSTTKSMFTVLDKYEDLEKKMKLSQLDD